MPTLSKTPDPIWSTVDDYFNSVLIPKDSALDLALADSAAAGLPAIAVTAAQGKLLQLLAQSINAKNILEIGLLGGYSTIFLARALSPGGVGGKITTLEINPDFAKVAAANIARAGFANAVDIRIGKAIDSLPKIAAEKREPFDLVFIDADKPSNPDYFSWALKLTRKGSLIIVDNVVRHGEVADGASTDESVRGARRVLEMMGAEPRVSATAIQTVGSKGYDGFAIARVK